MSTHPMSYVVSAANAALLARHDPDDVYAGDARAVVEAVAPMIRRQVAREIADAISAWIDRENLSGRAHWAATRAAEIALLLRKDQS